MSNRTLLEFNHDVNWTGAPQSLLGVLDEVRRSIPTGDTQKAERVRTELIRLGITYIETRHHSDPRADQRIAALVAQVAELKTENKLMARQLARVL